MDKNLVVDRIVAHLGGHIRDGILKVDDPNYDIVHYDDIEEMKDDVYDILDSSIRSEGKCAPMLVDELIYGWINQLNDNDWQTIWNRCRDMQVVTQ